MQNYQNNYQDQLGNAIPGAIVVVRLYPSNVLATIYSDNGITPLPNPTTTDSLGLFNFFAADGTYSITCAKTGFATKVFNAVQLFDPSSLTSFPTLNITSTTQSTSPTTGALIVSGGIGVAKDIFSGGTYHGGVVTTSGSVDSVPIGATTPSTGVFTTLNATGATSVTTLAATGAITPSQTAGIVGTTTNNNANAGSIGEYFTATGSGVSLTNNIPANGVSISLGAGDWDVDGVGTVDAAGGAVVGGTLFSLGTSSATLATPRTAILANLVANGSAYLPCPTIRLSITSLTVVYLVVQASFASGTVSGGGTIRARRVR
jgi:hypothetical protein